jgi:hypothetical protein
MLSSLVTSQTRVKLLIKFFLNSNTRAHLRGLESELGESSNSIRIELNRFESAGLLNSLWDGNRKLYQANKKHPLFSDIHNIILKETGIDRVIEKVIRRMGNLLAVYLIGDFAMGKDSPVVELILIGLDIDKEYLSRKIIQAEGLCGRKVNCIIIKPTETKEYLAEYKPDDIFLLWDNGSGYKGEKSQLTF